MKTLRLIATLMLFGSLTLGMAEATIDEQISAIQSATPEERVTLVNEFKETLSALSTEERTEAITQLRSTMSEDGEALQTQTQTKMRIRSRENQAEQTEDMQMSQQMQQKQAGTQAMQEGQIGAGTPLDGHTPNRFMGKK